MKRRAIIGAMILAALTGALIAQVVKPFMSLDFTIHLTEGEFNALADHFKRRVVDTPAVGQPGTEEYKAATYKTVPGSAQSVARRLRRGVRRRVVGIRADRIKRDAAQSYLDENPDE